MRFNIRDLTTNLAVDADCVQMSNCTGTEEIRPLPCETSLPPCIEESRPLPCEGDSEPAPQRVVSQCQDTEACEAPTSRARRGAAKQAIRAQMRRAAREATTPAAPTPAARTTATKGAAKKGAGKKAPANRGRGARR